MAGAFAENPKKSMHLNLKFLKMKKTNLILILSLLTFTFFNCSKEETKDSSINNNLLNNNDLIGIHNKIKQNFNNNSAKFKTLNKITNEQLSYNNPNEQIGSQILSLEEQYTDNIFDTNYNYVLSNGLENLFQQYGLNSEIINIADWAMENINDDNLYNNLLTTFSINNEQEAYLLFYYIELYKEFNINQSSLSGCARAVIGTILVTAVFAGVTAASGGFGAAAAGGFLISKGWSIYNVIAACSAQVQLEYYYLPEIDHDLLIDINDPFNLNTPLLIP